MCTFFFFSKFSLPILTAHLSKCVILLYHSNEELRISGSVPSLVCVPSWHIQGDSFLLYADQEGNKLQRQEILSFIYPIYNHNWRNISTIYVYNKTIIKRNILTIQQNTSGSRSG